MQFSLETNKQSIGLFTLFLFKASVLQDWTVALLLIDIFCLFIIENSSKKNTKTEELK